MYRTVIPLMGLALSLSPSGCVLYDGEEKEAQPNEALSSSTADGEDALAVDGEAALAKDGEVTVAANESPESQADTGIRVEASCPGKRLRHIPVTTDGSTYGYLDVYYQKSTGKNCAMTQATGKVRGHASFIEVNLRRCRETRRGKGCNFDLEKYDGDHYKYYAGPVTVTAPGKCIYAVGRIKWKGHWAQGETSPVGDLCRS